MSRLTAADHATAQRYHKTAPKMLGNLHEQMQYVMEIARKLNDQPGAIRPALWSALCDLEHEVSFHQPAKPAFTQRKG